MDDQQPTKRRFQFRLLFIFLMTAMVALSFAGFRMGMAWWNDYWGIASDTRQVVVGSVFRFLPMMLIGTVMSLGRDGAQRCAGAAFVVSIAAIWAYCLVEQLFEFEMPYTARFGIDDVGFQLAALIGTCVAITRMLFVKASVTWCAGGAIAFCLLGFMVGVAFSIASWEPEISINYSDSL